MDLFDGSPRERYLLIGLGTVVVIALLALFIRGGGGGSSVSDANDIDTALRELQLVETALGNADVSDAPAAERAPFDRSALIRGAQAASMTLSRIEPAGSGFTVQLEPAPSASVLRFLQTLERTTTGEIIALELDATPDGLVDAQVTVEPRA